MVIEMENNPHATVIYDSQLSQVVIEYPVPKDMLSILKELNEDTLQSNKNSYKLSQSSSFKKMELDIWPIYQAIKTFRLTTDDDSMVEFERDVSYIRRDPHSGLFQECTREGDLLPDSPKFNEKIIKSLIEHGCFRQLR